MIFDVGDRHYPNATQPTPEISWRLFAELNLKQVTTNLGHLVDQKPHSLSQLIHACGEPIQPLLCLPLRLGKLIQPLLRPPLRLGKLIQPLLRPPLRLGKLIHTRRKLIQPLLRPPLRLGKLIHTRRKLIQPLLRPPLRLGKLIHTHRKLIQPLLKPAQPFLRSALRLGKLAHSRRELSELLFGPPLRLDQLTYSLWQLEQFFGQDQPAHLTQPLWMSSQQARQILQVVDREGHSTSIIVLARKDKISSRSSRHIPRRQPARRLKRP